MKLLHAVVVSGALCVGLNAQTIGLNAFPEYEPKPDHEMLDLAGKVSAKKLLEYLTEMRMRYNKMDDKEKAEFLKHFQDTLAKNIAKLKPAQLQKRLATIKKALETRAQKLDLLRKEVDEEFEYISFWRKSLDAGTFEQDLHKYGFVLPVKPVKE
ncbi:DUF1104 domain-containing protein [Helicobacter suis]|uniref:Periplasmic protein n=1 Tax=Helicobacter suis TaxID=104628 RepID=A0A6J4D0X0_9HELI|nr:DUF1104 domain-containing protein [Helicobacter suis]BCD46753.1 hypothetical protein NHP190020_17920 [Helicobacter suis]BCD48527.1 hypothetical protein NHP194003_17310 [Helicobacter suis]BCD50306.1 hypothetical protein NHP194004_17530 [Helicobacter suis]BCD52047.1 hypothetical protein NHP194022_17180 [Helicobacter suis]BCD71084.1 hypothetical protein SNTW_17290 [Helicobacter suis]